MSLKLEPAPSANCWARGAVRAGVGLPPPVNTAARDEISGLLSKMCDAVAFRHVMSETSALRDEMTMMEYRWRKKWMDDAAASKGVTARRLQAQPSTSTTTSLRSAPMKQLHPETTSETAGAPQVTTKSDVASIGPIRSEGETTALSPQDTVKPSTGSRRPGVEALQLRQFPSLLPSERPPERRMSLDIHEEYTATTSQQGAAGGGGGVVQGNAKLRAEVAAIKMKLRGALGRGDRHAAAAAVLELAHLEPEMKAAVKNGARARMSNKSNGGTSPSSNASHDNGAGAEDASAHEAAGGGIADDIGCSTKSAKNGRLYNRVRYMSCAVPGCNFLICEFVADRPLHCCRRI